MDKTEQKQLLHELWYKRNPCHDENSDGEDLFWGTVLCVFDDLNKALTPTAVVCQREQLPSECVDDWKDSFYCDHSKTCQMCEK